MARLVLALVLLALAVAAHAAGWRALADQNSMVWDSKDGLPHNQVNALAQTPDGLLWVGTYEGLARFDGVAYSVLRPENTAGLADASVRDLFVDGRGRLAAAMGRGGASLREDGQWRVIEGLQPPPGVQALEIVVDRAGAVWVGYDDGAVRRWSEAAGTSIIDGLPGGQVRVLALAADDAVWVGSTRGLARLHAGGVRRFGPADGLPEGPVSALLPDAAGGVLVGLGEQVLQGRDADWRVQAQSPKEGAITALVQQSGVLVAGTTSSGLFRTDGAGEYETFDRLDGLANDRIVSMLVDREGSLWVGTSRGLQRFAAMPVRNITNRDGLGDAYVRSLVETSEGSVYIGGVSGLYQWRMGRAERIEDREGRPIDSVLSLAPAQDGGLWIGTYTAGIRRLRDGRIEPVEATPQVPAGAEIRGLLEERPGRLWVATNLGIFLLEDGRTTAFDRDDGLPSEHVRRLHLDRRGVLWAATNLGLARFEQTRFQPIDVSAANDARTVFAIHEDASGAFWLATDRGLVLFRDGQPPRGTTLEEGLAPTTLFEVIEDAGGNLWVDSNRGIAKILAASIPRWVEGEGALEVLALDEAAGMITAQASGGAGPAMLQRRASGEIWAALAGGIARVNPDDLDTLSAAPPGVVILGVRVDGRDVPTTSAVAVPPGSLRLEIDYVSPTYRTTRGLLYRHRLVGLDADWVLAQRNQRSTEYTNLAPGAYRFEVQASFDGRRWSGVERPIAVQVLVEWWRHPWALAAAIVLALAAVYGAFRMRVRLLEGQRRELTALVEARTRELAEKNRSLEELNRRIRSQSEGFETQAMTDALTGLPNRRAFEARLQAPVLQGEPIVVGLLDIDHFKRINDTHSHEAGDRVLELVAELLRHETGMGQGRRNGDPLVARWGGEEFAILWPGLDITAAQAAAEGVRRKIAEHDFTEVFPGGSVTVSIGLSAGACRAGRLDELIRAADERLYAAKAAGRNRIEA